MTTLLSILAGLALPTLYMLTIRLHQCRCCLCRGHTWERFQIEGAHYRDPASTAFRMCKRCGDTELIEPERALAVTDVVARVMANDRNKPRPTHEPSDGRSCPR